MRARSAELGHHVYTSDLVKPFHALLKPKQILEASLNAPFVDSDGDPSPLELAPGLSEEELREFEGTLPRSLPEEIRELLRFARGFRVGAHDDVDFTGGYAFAYEDAFACCVPIAPDGFGNFWVIDVNVDTGAWGPVFYACHDPPVMAVQAPTLSAFLEQWLESARTDDQPSAIDEVHEEHAHRIWRDHPALIEVSDALASSDEALRQFAQGLGAEFAISDLRKLEVGSGFAWGWAGPEGKVRRAGASLLFAVEKGQPKKSSGLVRRLFGRG
jgi:hypothetical protein